MQGFGSCVFLHNYSQVQESYKFQQKVVLIFFILVLHSIVKPLP